MPAKITSFDADDLVRRYLAGETREELAARYGISLTTVHWRLHDAGVKVGSRTKIDVSDELLDAFRGGESVESLVNRFGVPRSVIYRALREHGIPRTRKRVRSINIAELVRRYQSGESRRSLALEHGVTDAVIDSRLREAGIEIRPRSGETVDKESVVAAYVAGESEKFLADSNGVSRRVIRLILEKAGVSIRQPLAANRLMTSKRTPEKRQRFAAASHDAVRGKRQTFEHRCLIAKAREERPSNVSPAETQLTDWLREAGYVVTQQKAIGPYNADLAIDSIAVELFGGAFHLAGSHVARSPKRSRYLLDQGWSQIIIWVDASSGRGLTHLAAEYVIAFIDHSRRNPSSGREYRVIWGTGEEVATSSPHFYKIAPIPATDATDGGGSTD